MNGNEEENGAVIDEKKSESHSGAQIGRIERKAHRRTENSDREGNGCT